MVTTAMLIGLAALLVAAAAERLHAARVARVARLAFGPGGRPAEWARIAPTLRVAAVGAAAWGAAVLATFDPVHRDERPKREPSKQLIICLDVSPSMQLKDAGPGTPKVSRAAWGGRVVQGILDRLDTETTRVSLMAFYTKALPVVQETFDKEVVRNALDGLPMYVAFEPGPTDIHKGVSAALDLARVWPRKSAVLVVVSDGDASASAAAYRLPDSISDAIVIGVGDPHRSSVINGHGSRQDAASLQQLAARLGGVYHNGNEKHLPSEVLSKLSVTNPRNTLGVGLREAALVAVGAGGASLALLDPLLILFGRTGPLRRVRSRPAQAAAGSERAPPAAPVASLEAAR